MGIFSFSSLRIRLLVLVLLAVLPALGLITYTAFEQRRYEASEAEQEALRLARLVSANQKQLIEATHQLLVTLAKLPEVQRQDYERCSQLFSDLLEEYPLYANFGVTKPNGDVFCSGQPMSGKVNIFDRLYFREAVRTKDFAIGEYQIGRITNKASINFGQPVLNRQGEIDAVVFAAMDLQWFKNITTEMRLPQGATVTLIDHKGVVLIRIPDPESWVGKSAADTTIVKTVLSEKVGTTWEVGLDGRERLYGFTTLILCPVPGEFIYG